MEPEDMPELEDDVFTATAKAMGLYPKYDVIKRTTGELVTDPVFVLNPQTDPLALVVLDLYAGLALMDGYTELANDIGAWTHRIKHGGHPTFEGVEEWANSDFLTRVKIAKARLKLQAAQVGKSTQDTLEQIAREQREENS